MEAGKRRDEADGIALERRREVLDQVDLVDVASGDRFLDGLDGLRVVIIAPGALPLADAIGANLGRGLVERTNATGGEWEPAGLGRVRRRGPANRLREPVAEIEVGDESVRAEEPFVPKVVLDRRESALGLPE